MDMIFLQSVLDVLLFARRDRFPDMDVAFTPSFDPRFLARLLM